MCRLCFSLHAFSSCKQMFPARKFSSLRDLIYTRRIRSKTAYFDVAQNHPTLTIPNIQAKIFAELCPELKFTNIKCRILTFLLLFYWLDWICSWIFYECKWTTWKCWYDHRIDSGSTTKLAFSTRATHISFSFILRPWHISVNFYWGKKIPEKIFKLLFPLSIFLVPMTFFVCWLNFVLRCNNHVGQSLSEIIVTMKKCVEFFLPAWFFFISVFFGIHFFFLL